uniref:Histone deacetylase 10 n=1 Tax=Varanus komodoensis TaxID=61221 RepID=A0A8D2Q7I4_VARKO
MFGFLSSADYLEVVKSTQEMKEEELQKTSADYDSVYFHPTTFRCAKLAVGATLELVDAVMLGKTRNGMALVRPPGHHSQRNAANGFCIFNNVAIAAKYAQRTYGLQRILIVDWDVHHGQGTQYLFDADPSVLYFSWHRFEHQQFWPSLSESNYDAVGQEKGRGFNINVPWNKIGMGNSDYIAAFLHVLLPVAFEHIIPRTLPQTKCRLSRNSVLCHRVKRTPDSSAGKYFCLMLWRNVSHPNDIWVIMMNILILYMQGSTISLYALHSLEHKFRG